MYARLNLASTPLVSHRRFYIGSAFFGLVALVLCVFLGLRLHDVRKAQEDFRAKSDKLQAEMDRVMAQKRELDRFYAKEENQSLDRYKYLAALMEADSFNWTKMFMDLEQTLPKGVHVLKIEPKLEKGTVSVRFQAGAQSEDAKLELFKAFEDSRSFSHFELYSDVVQKQPVAGADALTVEFSVIYTGI